MLKTTIPEHTNNAAKNITSLMKAFPKSFDTMGNTPRHYTIGTDPCIKPVHHACRKVPIGLQARLELKFKEMVDHCIITPMEWVNTLTCPQKPDGTLCIWLDPQDLNKAILCEYYKPPN